MLKMRCDSRRNWKQASPTKLLHFLILAAASLPGLDAELVVGDHMVSNMVRNGALARLAVARNDNDRGIAAISDLTAQTSAVDGYHSMHSRDDAQHVISGSSQSTFSVPQEGIALSSDNVGAKALLSCYNDNYKNIATEFADFTNGQLSASLHIHRLWWSKRRSSFPLSLFTYLSFNRADSLEALCRSYPGGGIAAAVWVPLLLSGASAATGAITTTAAARRLMEQQHQHTTANAGDGPDAVERLLAPPQRELLRNTTVALSDLFRRIESSSAPTCLLRLMVVSELVAEPQLAVLPPVNALRNMALLAVDSPLAAMVDADMSVSGSLAGRVMSDPTRTADLVRRAEGQRLAWVLPSWDINHHMPESQRGAMVDAMLAVRPEAKQSALLDMWRTKQEILPAASDRHVPGYNATDYDKWVRTAEEYPVEFQEGYEPWFFAARRALPPYDDRFRGHYFGRVSHVRHASRSGQLKLVVLPDAWVVHRPHGTGATPVADNDISQLAKDLGLSQSPMDQLVTVNGTVVQPWRTYLKAAQLFYAAARAGEESGNYKPVVQPAVQHCREVLPWWRQQAAAASGRRRLARALTFRGTQQAGR